MLLCANRSPSFIDRRTPLVESPLSTAVKRNILHTAFPRTRKRKGRDQTTRRAQTHDIGFMLVESIRQRKNWHGKCMGCLEASNVRISQTEVSTTLLYFCVRDFCVTLIHFSRSRAGDQKPGFREARLCGSSRLRKVHATTHVENSWQLRIRVALR